MQSSHLTLQWGSAFPVTEGQIRRFFPAHSHKYEPIKRIGHWCPPLELQNQFAAFVEQTEKTKTTISRSLEKLETLKKALMQECFG